MVHRPFQRTQVVKISQESSKPTSITCGVPKGSILGPLLFLVYFKIIQFADDTITFTSSKIISDLEFKLNEDMSAIHNYSKTNELIINLKRGKQNAC